VATLVFEDNDGVLAELEDHLPAGAAGRAWQVVAIHHGHSADGQLRAFRLLDSRENCRALGAYRKPVGSVLDVAALEDLPLLGEDGSADTEVGVTSISALQRLARCSEKGFLLLRR